MGPFLFLEKHVPRNGSGEFQLVTGNPVVTGTNISSSVHNSTLNDIAAEMTNSLPRDGQAAMTGALDMGSQKVKNLGSGTLRSDAISVGQAQDGAFQYVGTVGGTANAITLTPAPAITTYTAGQGFSFKVSSANSGAVTVAVSGLAAKNLTKRGATALGSGDLPANSLVYIQYDGTQFQVDRVADVVTVTGTQTLTNKTLTSPTVSSPTITSPQVTGGTFDNPTLAAPTINGSIGGSAIASQAQMEAATANDAIVTPRRMIDHPGVAKALGLIRYAGSTPTLSASFGVASINGVSTGTVDITLTTAMSNTNYVVGCLASTPGGSASELNIGSRTTTTFRLQAVVDSGASSAPQNVDFQFFVYGDQ